MCPPPPSVSAFVAVPFLKIGELFINCLLYFQHPLSGYAVERLLGGKQTEKQNSSPTLPVSGYRWNWGTVDLDEVCCFPVPLLSGKGVGRVSRLILASF